MRGKHVVLGVSGSIAAFKAADLASKLVQAGALVDSCGTGFILARTTANRTSRAIPINALTGLPCWILQSSSLVG